MSKKSESLSAATRAFRINVIMYGSCPTCGMPTLVRCKRKDGTVRYTPHFARCAQYRAARLPEPVL